MTASAALAGAGCTIRTQAPIKEIAYDFSDRDFYDRAYAPSPKYLEHEPVYVTAVAQSGAKGEAAEPLREVIVPQRFGAASPPFEGQAPVVAALGAPTIILKPPSAKDLPSAPPAESPVTLVEPPAAVLDLPAAE